MANADAHADASTDDSERARDRLKRAMLARFPVRVHLAVILAGCFVTGLLVTTMLHVVGLQEMFVRYPIALLAAYGFFVLGIRIWLQYAGYVREVDGGRVAVGSNSSSSGSGGWWAGSWGSNSRSPSFSGGGGSSGGAGASGTFDAAADGSVKSATAGLASGGRSSGVGVDLDLDDGVWVIVALAAAVAGVFGAAVYLVYAAPTILCDAAFAALLSGGLIRSTRRIAGTGWMGSVLHDTWLPFAVVLLLTLVFAAVAHHVFPEAHTVLDVLRRL